MNYIYLLLNLFTLSGPLVLSFDKKVQFVRRWKYLFPAIFITGFIFIVWDVWFTKLGVWSFNEDFLWGYKWLNLPVEEWMFFITIPFACVFIYEVLGYYFTWNQFQTQTRIWTGIASAFLIITGLWAQGIYTQSAFLLSGGLLAFLTLYPPAYLTRFWVTYFVHLIPFFIVNGVLTALPVVLYNDEENLGFRIGSIPVEDTIYSLALLLINIQLYEWFASKANQRV